MNAFTAVGSLALGTLLLIWTLATPGTHVIAALSAGWLIGNFLYYVFAPARRP